MEILSKITALADDILIGDHNGEIEETNNTIKERLERGRLIINGQKSEIVEKRSNCKREIDGLESKTFFKYLGVTFEVKGDTI